MSQNPSGGSPVKAESPRAIFCEWDNLAPPCAYISYVYFAGEMAPLPLCPYPYVCMKEALHV